MARLFALADLHLSGTGDKPMDVFGELWVDHARRMAEAWDRSVGEEDTVLLPGDLSWARNLAEAEVDLRWIGARPGRKLLLRGNHDAWWTSAAKARAALPRGCEILQNDAARWREWVIVGSRGWTSPEDPIATEDDGKVFRRELGRLKMSIDDADKRFGRELPRMAIVHYPPLVEGQSPGEVVEMLRAGGVRLVAYGHLHGDDHRIAIRGPRHGLHFCFVASDGVGFAPVELPLEAALRGD